MCEKCIFFCFARDNPHPQFSVSQLSYSEQIFKTKCLFAIKIHAFPVKPQLPIISKHPCKIFVRSPYYICDLHQTPPLSILSGNAWLSSSPWQFKMRWAIYHLLIVNSYIVNRSRDLNKREVHILCYRCCTDHCYHECIIYQHSLYK